MNRTEVPTSVRQTDDRGAFRLFGLRPGSYRVCANPTRAGADAGPDGTASQPSCYPADDEPGGLALSTSDTPDIEIRIRRGRSFTISGTVVDASGAPASDVSVSVLKRAGFESYESASVRGGGRFRASGLAPGDYVVQGSIGREYDPLDTREHQVGVLHVRVDSGDVDGLVLALARGARVTGKVLVDDRPLPERTRIAVTALYDDPVASGLNGPEPAAAVSDASTFELANIFGPVRFACGGLPPGWVVKAVRYQDRDITNRLTEFPAGSTQSIEVIISSRGAGLMGSVSDRSGAPASEGTAVVLVIPVDYTGEWVTGMPNAPVTRDGTFKTSALRAGEYLVAAVDSGQMVSMIVTGEQNLKTRLSKVAQRVELSEGERRSLDLRVVTIPEER